MEKKASLRFVFTGQSHQIDANTLINALINYTAVINETNRIYGEGNKSVNIKVNAIEKGSFVIDLSVVENVFMGLLTDSLSYLADLTTIVTGVFAVYKLCHGKPARGEDAEEIEIDNVKLKDAITKVYNNSQVREIVSKSFETASQDSGIDGLEISGSTGEVVKFDSSEFPELIYTDFAQETDIPNQRVVTDRNASLVITKLSFERGSLWGFMYNGFRISIPMRDAKLAELIERGERFGKGDSIRAIIEITQRYNDTYKAYENKSYRIVEFIEHIEFGVQDNRLF